MIALPDFVKSEDDAETTPPDIALTEEGKRQKKLYEEYERVAIEMGMESLTSELFAAIVRAMATFHTELSQLHILDDDCTRQQGEKDFLRALIKKFVRLHRPTSSSEKEVIVQTVTSHTVAHLAYGIALQTARWAELHKHTAL